MVIYPGVNGRVALVLVDHDLQLALKLCSLLLGRLSIWSHARHVLNNDEANLVASLVEQVRLNLDLISRIVSYVSKRNYG